jgi:hypothetical protein
MDELKGKKNNIIKSCCFKNLQKQFEIEVLVLGMHKNVT